VLANTYYMGLVTFQGLTLRRQARGLGRHRNWLQVQDVLTIRAHRGEKERKHPPYLRGTIYCGACGERLVDTQHNGRGGRHTYYGSIKKRLGSRYCPSRVIRLEKIEDGIAALYRPIELPEAEIERLRLAGRGELAGHTADAHEHTERANRRLAQLTAERAKLLRAHLDGAVPVDLLKTEMDRRMRARAAAESEAAVPRAELGDIEQLLEQALAVAGSCWRHYLAAPTFCGGRRIRASSRSCGSGRTAQWSGSR
jgi:site-specific DNA recombinase